MTIDQLRTAAVTQTLFAPTSLGAAIRRLGFVQADPIRAPARAQDLILRHRVDAYAAGDLERAYPRLRLDEDVLYAYGFVPRETLRLLHPRVAGPLAAFDREVLAVVREHGPLHPAELQTWFGRERVVNAWGGYSQATKRALERLHHHGFLRVVRRDAGVRVYAAAPSAAPSPAATDDERMRGLIRIVVNILSPIPERTLSGIAAYLASSTPSPGSRRTLIGRMVAAGELVRATTGGIAYLRLPGRRTRAEPRSVRLLAPFDPVVWDRRRFEHLWEWAYRFEAYTPTAKRIRGYYALPLLWRSRVIGWANVRSTAEDVDVEFGFIDGRPLEREFESELTNEVDRLREFLRPRTSSR